MKQGLAIQNVASITQPELALTSPGIPDQTRAHSDLPALGSQAHATCQRLYCVIFFFIFHV